MSRLTRRDFIKGSVAAMATITIAGTKSSGRVLGANETIRIGVAGLNGRGASHVGAFAPMQDVQITYLIDPDTRTYRARQQQIGNRSNPRTVQDVRRCLEDRNVDAISIATPNHWHSLMTIWAAQAGKHVYVEKPCSHNVHEGRIAVAMARRHNVIVQHGTQSRTEGPWANIIEAIKSGRYGRLLVSRAIVYKLRNSIGNRPTGNPPTELDFNLWLGPAQRTDYHANLVHYNWHWFWAFGNGDIGNQGVHQMDIARWAINGATLPRSVVSVGGRFGYTDQGETPNTQVTLMDFGDSKLIFEVRGLSCRHYRGQGTGNDSSNHFHLEQGIISGNRFYPRGEGQGEAIPNMNPRRGPGGGSHFANFIAAVRSGRRADLNADIEEGHYSSALCHLANISYQMGTNAPFAPRTRAFGDNRDAIETLERMEAHLSGPPHNLRLADLQLKVGPLLQVQARTENFGDNATANRYLTRQYREGFVVPDRVG
ncbi:MAG TPA: Gfo/Idh/MocA family oxidoreductase [Gemmataceae bacterium]|nr:Gfo/Idh/MocA family oxidoreductase [Gemmataceae bacterium]